MKLTILGTATPYPRPDRPCSGYLLESARAAIWIDAGPGTLAELQRLRPLSSLDAIWVSHRHADHTTDLLPAYYGLRYGPDAPAAVPLFAPDGMRERIEGFVGPGAEEKVRTALPARVVQGFGDALIGDLHLSWAPVRHGVPAFALRVDAGTSSFVYSGDCGPSPSLAELADGAGTLLCEAGYARDPGPAQERVHLTPEDAADAATEAGVQRLLLTHLGEGLSEEDAVRRAAGRFGGTVLAAMPRKEYTV